MQQKNKSSKKVQVDKAKVTVFIIVAVSAVVTIGALMISRSLWSKTSYINKVVQKQEDARDQLEENKKSVEELAKSYKTLVEQNPNMLGGSSTGTGERDGNNAELILDSLPNKYDFPALTASVEKLLLGYSINSIEGIDDSIAQQAGGTTGPVEMPFTLDILATYGTFRDLVNSFNRSIRPIKITKIELQGTNAVLDVNITASTYYQPQQGLQISEVKVQ